MEEESPVVADNAISGGVETSAAFFDDGDESASASSTLSVLFFSETSPTAAADITAFESVDLVSALRGPLSPVVC